MPTHHVYADANIFLDFFRFSDDDLGELQKLAKHIGDDNIVLYLPQITAEEYFRNRDKVVLDQLKEIKQHKLNVGIPIFIRDGEASKTFQATLDAATAARSELLKEAEALASSRAFRADQLIDEIFAKARSIPTSPRLLEEARKRMSLGNPPGKPASIGDRLNWESLLDKVPNGNDLYLLTRDTDYIASFGEAVPNMFLVNEWRAFKGGNLHLFKGIKRFAQLVDETIVFDFNDAAPLDESPEKGQLISGLSESKSFSTTHALIAKLNHLRNDLNESDIEELLDIALFNGQVGMIIGDDDLHEFYSHIRFKLPITGNEVAERFDERFDIIPF